MPLIFREKGYEFSFVMFDLRKPMHHYGCSLNICGVPTSLPGAFRCCEPVWLLGGVGCCWLRRR